MNWKTFVSAYLNFSRKDRIGILVLLLLIVMVYALPYLVPHKETPPIVLDDSLQNWLDSSRKVQVAGYRSDKGAAFDDTPALTTEAGAPKKINRFEFDPNTLDAAGWLQLGLRERTVRTILNYRAKGGKFYKKEDVQKIWGLPQGFYQSIEPYINIQQTEYNKIKEQTKEPTKLAAENTLKLIDINNADVPTLESLPGIGPKLASRIVNFRNKLGGFVSIEQVGSTYGLPDSTFQMIKPRLYLNTSKIDKIKINTASKEILSAHPYISWELARSIVTYREQHGPFKSIEDLSKLMLIDERTVKQLLPYLQFD